MKPAISYMMTRQDGLVVRLFEFVRIATSVDEEATHILVEVVEF